MLQWLREQRRLHLLAQPFPETWDSFLFRDVAHYPLLSEDQRALLRDNMRILVAEKYWEGCGGLQVTEEMKVTIAAQACLLLLGSDNEFFSRVLSILVYPSVFTIPGEWSGEDETRGVFSGQAVYRGPAILAWEQVIAEGRNPAEGHNVVIHEFAHHLDYLDGYINGTPDLSDPELAEQWGPVMTADYRHWCETSARDGPRSWAAMQRTTRRSSSRWPRSASLPCRGSCGITTGGCTKCWLSSIAWSQPSGSQGAERLPSDHRLSQNPLWDNDSPLSFPPPCNLIRTSPLHLWVSGFGFSFPRTEQCD